MTKVLVHVRAYQWENKLSLDDRKRLVIWYNEGYAIRQIAKGLHLGMPSVQYHLKIAGVYRPGKRPSKWNQPLPPIPERDITRSLSLYAVVPKDLLSVRSFVHLGLDTARQIKFEQKLPKSYNEYVRKERDRIEKRNAALIQQLREQSKIKMYATESDTTG